MSTIINVLTNPAFFDGASTNDIVQTHNASYGVGGNLYAMDDLNNRPAVAIAFSTTSTPSLKEIAPELNDVSIKRLKFIVLGVIGSLLAVLGFLGNTMSIVVLQQRQMRSSTSYYLLSLAIYDNLIVLSMLLYFIVPALASNVPFMKDYLASYAITEPVGYPLSLTAQMGSIYTCVGFTVERFIAVCRPLQVANTCTKSRTIRAIVLIFVWSVIYNIPRFFHLHAVYVYDDAEAPAEAPTNGVHGDTVGLVSTLASSSIRHQLNNDFPLHANASAPLLVSPYSTPTVFVGAPCVSDGRGNPSTPKEDSWHYGLTSPCDTTNYNRNGDIMTLSDISIAPSYSLSSMVSPSSSPASSPSSTSSSPTAASLPSPSPSSPSSLQPSPSLLPLNVPPLPVPSQTTNQNTKAAFLPPSPASAVPTSSSLSSSSSSLSPSSSSSPSSNDDKPNSKNRGVKHIKATLTNFGSDPIFKNIYLIYSQLFFMFLLPFLIILVMNIGLIRAVKKSKAMQQRMATSASARKERNLTVMLIAVIVVFLACQFPTIVDNILIAVLGGSSLYPNYQYQCFYTACTLMVLVNAASNFLLYCFFGKKFRVVFLSLLGINKRQQYVAYRSTMYRSRSNGSRGCDMEMSVV